MYSRRELMGRIVASAAVASSVSSYAVQQASVSEGDERTVDLPLNRSWETIDTNAHLFHWPFRRVPYDSVQEFVAKLSLLDIRQAWVGSYEGILHRDVAGVNERLAATCSENGKGKLQAIGTINLALPDWENDVRLCDEVHHMIGVRIYPNYHDYSLASSEFARLLAMAGDRKLLVQVSVSLEDRRTQHPRLQVEDVNLAPLREVVAQFPRTKIQLLNHKLSAATIADYSNQPQIFFDVARIEGTGSIAAIVRKIGASKILFGTHAPLFIPESALIKVYESDLDDNSLSQILGANALQLSKS